MAHPLKKTLLGALAGAAIGLWPVIAGAQDGSLTDTTLSDIALPAPDERTIADYVFEQKRQASLAAPGEASRIIGGRESEPGAWPGQAAIVELERYGDDEESRILSQFCGATLLTRQWVLTAAHCVVDMEGRPIDPATIGVVTGSVFVFDGDLRRAAEIVVHENYDPVLIDNDIALIRLSEPITTSSGPVGAVRVAQQNQSVPQGPAVVMGWGLIAAATVPYQLLETDIDIVPNEVCNRGMAEQTKRDLGSMLVGIGVSSNIPIDRIQEAFDILVANMGPRLNANMICAGVPTGERTSCNGDSGGPLMVREEDGRWLQVGIVSWGQEPLNADEPCAHPELFAVYTNLARYYDWIAGHVAGG